MNSGIIKTINLINGATLMIQRKLLLFCCFLVLLTPVSVLAYSVGDPMPTFVGTDLNGHPVDLTEIVGKKPVMLIFWTSWCSDCKDKLPEINELVMKYRHKGMVFIGINTGNSDTIVKARAYIKEHKMSYPNVFDKTGELTRKYELNKPFALVMANQDGKVVMKFNSVPKFGDETLKALMTKDDAESNKQAPVKTKAEK
jgi:peroxiredoxin